jgi:ribonuclease D
LPLSAPPGAARTVDELRLLKALETERAAIARRLRIAPRRVASDDALAALARARARRADDPAFREMPDAAAFQQVILRHMDEP